MARDKVWKWRAHAMRENPTEDSPTVVLLLQGSNSNGDFLFELRDEAGGTPCMTAAEWRNFALELISGRGSPVKE